jgi:hypothetical protein
MTTERVWVAIAMFSVCSSIAGCEADVDVADLGVGGALSAAGADSAPAGEAGAVGDAMLGGAGGSAAQNR